MYNEKVMEIFKNPKNVGEVENYNAIGTVGNATCGDIMQITLRIEDGIIKDAKFKTFGCAAAITSSSVATSMIIGKTIDEALKVTNKDVITELNGLPPQKIHCSVLAEEAIKAAIDSYRQTRVTGTFPRRLPLLARAAAAFRLRANRKANNNIYHLKIHRPLIKPCSPLILNTEVRYAKKFYDRRGAGRGGDECVRNG